MIHLTMPLQLQLAVNFVMVIGNDVKESASYSSLYDDDLGKNTKTRKDNVKYPGQQPSCDPPK
jgi:hypothetical protein